jgi:hypothetical protein
LLCSYRIAFAEKHVKSGLFPDFLHCPCSHDNHSSLHGPILSISKN